MEKTEEKGRLYKHPVSVAMSVYREKTEFLSHAVDSVLRQTYKDFDFFIVCDDPDNADAKEYLKKKCQEDPRIKLIENDKNIGLAMSLDKAIAQSESEFIMRMDADDVCMPDRMTTELEMIKKSGCDVVFSDYRYIDENGTVIGKKAARVNDPAKQMMVSNVIHHPTSFFRKDAFDKVGGYRDFPCSQDYDLWLRMLENGATFYYIDRCLLDYRITDDSISQSKASGQSVTTAYIKRLFFQRKFFKKDSFSKDDYRKYTGRFAGEIEDRSMSLSIKEKLRTAKALSDKGRKLSAFWIKAGILKNSACYRVFFFYKSISKIYVTLFVH